VLSSAFRKKGTKESGKFWALQEVSFDIQKGERIGIIGRNGAGKSTLLKIISQITPPTSGRIVLNGKVASLLEVGTGFHPELTGRENIYLNGAILGLAKKEITTKLEEIIDFSGVEPFIDTPLKHYSSGMQLRLAFSVAAHLEPEILLIDEVLAVGDLEFQKKCLGKMEEVSKAQGRTILFVSHNLAAVSTLTDKTIFLEAGRLQCFDKTATAIAAYIKSGVETQLHRTTVTEGKPAIQKVLLKTSEEGNFHIHGRPLSIAFDIYMPWADTKNMALAFQVIHQQTGVPVFHQWLFDTDTPMLRSQGVNHLQFTFPKLKLYKGDYHLKVHLADSKTKIKFDEAECCFFSVDMLNIPEPEWGWYDNMCLYLEDGKWEQL
jgi:lipopolysaccharide transport system ATP-binding protein